jgi:hypothetical protein
MEGINLGRIGVTIAPIGITALVNFHCGHKARTAAAWSRILSSNYFRGIKSSFDDPCSIASGACFTSG